jgi:hypothetical protein
MLPFVIWISSLAITSNIVEVMVVSVWTKGDRFLAFGGDDFDDDDDDFAWDDDADSGFFLRTLAVLLVAVLDPKRRLHVWAPSQRRSRWS